LNLGPHQERAVSRDWWGPRGRDRAFREAESAGSISEKAPELFSRLLELARAPQNSRRKSLRPARAAGLTRERAARRPAAQAGLRLFPAGVLTAARSPAN